MKDPYSNAVLFLASWPLSGVEIVLHGAVSGFAVLVVFVYWERTQFTYIEQTRTDWTYLRWSSSHFTTGKVPARRVHRIQGTFYQTLCLCCIRQIWTGRRNKDAQTVCKPSALNTGPWFCIFSLLYGCAMSCQQWHNPRYICIRRCCFCEKGKQKVIARTY